MSGVDCTQIGGVGVETVEVVLSEYGPDLSRFASEHEFISHATLASHVPKTGGKPVKKKKKKKYSASTRTAGVLRMWHARSVTTQSTPKKARFLKAYATVCQVTLAAEMAGIDRGTHYGWLKKDPGYRAQFEAANDQAAQTLEDEAVRRAYEGVERPVTVAGKRELAGVLRHALDLPAERPAAGEI
jgi:hypothetical protein